MDVKVLMNGLRTAACALAMLAVAPATNAQRPHSTDADAPVWNVATKDQVLDTMSKIIQGAAYVPGVDFSKWDEFLAKIKPQAEKAASEEEFAGIVNYGLRDAFKISHINLIPPSDVDERATQQKVGIGIRITPATEEGVLVSSTVPGAPAEKAGIEPGDIIMEADGHHVDGPTYIAGKVGTTVLLKVKKSNGTIKLIKVTRAQFSTKQKEELIPIDANTAAIQIHTFDLSYDRENVAELMTKAAKYKNLLVDLRSNGGGAVGNMMHFLSFLLDKDTAIGTFISKRSVDDFVEQKGGDRNDLKAIAEFSPDKVKVGRNAGPVYKGHVAVLVNPGSGSASEITAEALRELVSAPVIGRKSAGAVLVSVMGDLPHRFNIQYPISDYISVKGVRLEANGIVPDAEAADLPYVKKNTIDPAYKTAEDVLNKIAKSGA
jgi:carboxyl-terminal processing protease